MQDYVCNGSLTRSDGKQVCKYTMQNYLTHTGLLAKYQSYLSKITSLREPMNYVEGASDPKWIDAMNQELNSLKDNGT